MERGDMALLRVSELLNLTSYSIARWDDKFSEESKNNLLSVREQLQSIHDVLAKGAIAELEPKARLRLKLACQRVSSTYSQEYGTATKLTDSDGQHG
jgi:hypothetical protein